MSLSSRVSLFVSTVLALALMSACANNDIDTLDNTSDDSVLAELSPDGRYIIQFADSASKARRADMAIAVDFPTRNTVAAYLSDNEVLAMRKDTSIVSIEPDQRRYPTGEVVPYGITMVQADQLPATPAQSSGLVKVCIIDSGIKADHEDFNGLALDGTNVDGTGDWSNDLCGHGTHVAGTVAAVSGNDVGVVGVGPGAIEVHVVKVFGDSCGWTYSSGLISALDECTAAGADVVSMSLGGGAPSAAANAAFQQAYHDGTLIVASAGNDGNGNYNYPASYVSIISVAALDANKDLAGFSQQNRQVELAAPGVAVTSTYPYETSLAAPSDTYHGNQIVNSPSGNASGTLVDGGRCLTTGDWAGATVLCERGDISFYDKVMNVQNSGGAAAVLYNNNPGNFRGTLGDGNSSTIPALSLSQADGQAALADLGGQGDMISGLLGNGYADLNGTSMAAPHVSGVAALLWSQFPGLTNRDIRAALAATAEDLGDEGRDDQFGFGLVQAKAAYDYLSGN